MGFARACGMFGVQAPGDCGSFAAVRRTGLRERQNRQAANGLCDRRKQVIPAGDIVRHLRNGEEARRTTGLWPMTWGGRGIAMSGWKHAQTGLRPGSKHLCGQPCLHKLVDDSWLKP